jgi:hypothetical protein
MLKMILIKMQRKKWLTKQGADSQVAQVVGCHGEPELSSLRAQIWTSLWQQMLAQKSAQTPTNATAYNDSSTPAYNRCFSIASVLGPNAPSASVLRHPSLFGKLPGILLGV